MAAILERLYHAFGGGTTPESTPAPERTPSPESTVESTVESIDPIPVDPVTEPETEKEHPTLDSMDIEEVFKEIEPTVQKASTYALRKRTFFDRTMSDKAFTACADNWFEDFMSLEFPEPISEKKFTKRVAMITPPTPNKRQTRFSRIPTEFIYKRPTNDYGIRLIFCDTRNTQHIRWDFIRFGGYDTEEEAEKHRVKAQEVIQDIMQCQLGKTRLTLRQAKSRAVQELESLDYL